MGKVSNIRDHRVSRRKAILGLFALALMVPTSPQRVGRAFAKDVGIESDGDDNSGGEGEQESTSYGESEASDNNGSESDEAIVDGGKRRDHPQGDADQSDPDASLRDIEMRVKYADGYEEEVSGGTYRLTDSRGRVVITRPLTATDLRRLQALVR